MTSIVRLNVHELMSTFNKFSIILNSYQFEIIAVTKTWLQVTDYQCDYMQVNGYNTVFKNRTGKRGDGVRFYLKEQLQYKVGTDFTWNYTDLEILVVDIHGRNKNTSTLLCAVYQPSSIEVGKLESPEKFEQFLANIHYLEEGSNSNRRLLHQFTKSSK